MLAELKSFFFLFLNSNSIFSQNFEGKLSYKINYSGAIKILDSTYSFDALLKNKSGYFDTLSIYIKDSLFIKEKNLKYGYKKELTVLNDNKVYSFDGNKIRIDDLNFRDSFNKPHHKYGSYLSHKISDTVFSVKNRTFNVKKISVTREFATEIYFYSQELPTLAINRNLLINEEHQAYGHPLDTIIGNRILIRYRVTKLQFKNNNCVVDCQLFSILNNKLEESLFIIPRYRNTYETRKENKYSERFKYYKKRKIF